MRGTERPNHAAQIEVTELIEQGNAGAIEEAAGVSSPRWDDHKGTSLQLRRVALDTDASPQERLEACLAAAPLLLRMGLGSVATDLLLEVEPVLGQTDLAGPWKFARADLLLAARDFEALHTFFDKEDVPASDNHARSQWLLRKGQLALTEEKFSEAKVLIDEAAELGDAHEIDHARGQVLAAMDEWEDAVTWLEQAADGLQAPLARAHALSDLGRVLQDLGRETDGEKALSEAMHLGADDPHVMAKVHHHRFQGATARLALDEARPHLHHELECLRRCGDQAGHARAHIQIGLLDLVQHKPNDATPHFHEARDLCREAGLSNIEAHALTLGGVAARLSGDFGSALDAFVEAAALAEGQHELLAIIHAHRGAVEAACDAVDNAVAAFQIAETHLEAGWDALANTIHDVLTGFVDLARARDAALIEDVDTQAQHIDAALNRLARGSSFETRSTPPRGREIPSRINELRLARLLLDGALSALEPTD